MKIKIKKLHPDAVIPQYAHEGDSGFDLVVVENFVIRPGETKLVKTGISLELPKGYELQVRPRSGITLGTKLRVQLGTIDSNYRGEIGVIVDNVDDVIYRIERGYRIAQGVIAPVVQATFEEVDQLEETERGENGFGSTGV